MTEYQQRVQIINRLGLHARAAAKFVQTAGRYACDVWISRGEIRVHGKDIMEVMLLAASQGTWIDIHTIGQDALSAKNALVLLIENRFDEAQ